MLEVQLSNITTTSSRVVSLSSAMFSGRHLGSSSFISISEITAVSISSVLLFGPLSMLSYILRWREDYCSQSSSFFSVRFPILWNEKEAVLRNRLSVNFLVLLCTVNYVVRLLYAIFFATDLFSITILLVRQTEFLWINYIFHWKARYPGSSTKITK